MNLLHRGSDPRRNRESDARLVKAGVLLFLLVLAPLLWPDGAGAEDAAVAGSHGGEQPRGAPFGPLQEVGASWTEEVYRQFDFWIGEWEVNLRTLQDDNSWADGRSARAKIYRILDGRAILELWDERGTADAVRGYSLRFFDPAEERWRLFLNWPGRNRSGTRTLVGTFRHGRGEFYSTQTGADGSHTISRYTFSDIAPDRLRWDDAFSSDGGRTWRANWIMEFTREADRAAWPGEGEAAHTFHTGERCDRAEFREFERLEGRSRGEIRVLDSSGTERASAAQLAGYRVLDGCAVMTFLEYVSGGRLHRSFSITTFNTYIDQFEELHLDNQAGSHVRILYGVGKDGEIRLATRSGVHPPVRHTWKFPGEGRAARITERGAGGAVWRPQEILELSRIGVSTE